MIEGRIFMTKDEYIRKLRSELRFSLSAGEIRDIVGDISEVFADGIADGRSEGEICTSLGSPADAARNILTEHGISTNTGTSLAKAVIFVVIVGVALYLLWSSPSVGIFAAAVLPTVPLLIIEEGKLSHLAVNRASVLSLIAVILAAVGVFAFGRLADAVLQGNEAVLFPISGVLTAVAAVMLICAVLSVRVSRFGAVVPVCGGVISVVIISFMAYSAFHITERNFTDGDMSFEMIQIMYRSKFLNIFITTLFIAMALVFVTLSVKRDRLTLPCMYAVMGVMMILSKERGILRAVDPSMPVDNIIKLVPVSFIIAAAGMLIMSAAADIYFIRKAKCNG